MKSKKSSYTSVILIMLMTLCIVGGVIFIVYTIYEIRTTELNWVITDVTQYSEIRGQWNNEALFGHFPTEIPPSATEVHMMYSPPFLQKGLLFQLWLKLSESEIKTLQAEYDKVMLQKGKEKRLLNRFYPALTMFHTTEDPEGEALPKGYEIMVLEAESKDGGNHGHTYGVAINDSTSEILYWAEAW